MRAAQRSEGFHRDAQQQVEIITGLTHGEVVGKMADLVARYAVRIVCFDHWENPGNCGVTLVLEEEPA